MASKREMIRKDGSIAWGALYRRDGRQASATFPTMAARDRWVNLVDRVGLDAALEALEALESGSPTIPTFADYAAQDVADRDSSQREKNRNLKWVEQDFGVIGTLPLDAITPKIVRHWIRDQERKGSAPKTIRNKHGFMASVFKAAVADRALPEITYNPCAESKLPRVDTGTDDEVQALTLEEFARLLDFAPPAFRDFITVLAFTAMRWSEATALQVKAWHRDRGDHGELRVFRAWKTLDSGVKIGPPKTQKANRSLAVDKEVAAIIERHIEGKDPEDLIFTMPDGKSRIDHSNFYGRVWQPMLRLANGQPLLHRRTKKPMVDADGNTKVTRKHTFYGVNPARKQTKEDPTAGGVLGKWPTIHQLRHSGAAWMVEAVGDLQLVQEFLGHESITTTVDRYAAFLPHRKKAMAAGIGASMKRAFPEVKVLDGDAPKELEG